MQIRFDPFWCKRVGEAQHPGPGGSRRTARIRKQKAVTNILSAIDLRYDPFYMCRVGEASHPGPKGASLNSGNANLQQLLQPIISQLVTSLVQSLLQGNIDLGALLGKVLGQTGAQQPTNAKNAKKVDDIKKVNGTNKDKTKKKRKKKVKPLMQTTPAFVAPAVQAPSAPAPPMQRPDVSKPLAPQDGWQTVGRKASKSDNNGNDSWKLRAEDWNAPIIDFGNVAEQLDGCKEVFKAVVLCRADETDILHTMLRGCQVAYAVIIVSPDKKEGAVRTPGCVGRKLVFRDAVVTRCASNGQKLPEIARPKGQTAKINKKPTAVVHVKLFPQFFEKDDWTTVLNAPIRFFHDWLGKHHVKAIDSWGWSLERPSSSNSAKLFGLVRIAEDEVESLLASSGDGGVFLSPAKDVKITPTAIEWVEWVQGESWAAYLQKARRMGGEFGLIFGRMLGIRRKREPNAATSRIWLLEDVPKDFTQDQVCQVLSHSFSSVSLIRQKRGKKGHGHSFLFKAARTDEHDVVALPVDYDGASFTLWCRWAPPRQFAGEAKVVHNVQSWSLKTSVLDKSMPVAKDTLGEERSAAKGHDSPDDGSGTDGPSKRSKVEQRTLPDGVNQVTVPGDGACLFHAFKEAFAKISDKCLNSRALRAEVVTHMTRYKEHYSQQWSGFDPKGEKCTDFDTYLSLIAAEDAYASDIEVAALGRLYDVKIVVVPQVLAFPPVAFHVKQQKRIIALWFNGKHFDPLIPLGKSLPAALSQVKDTMPFPMRGGGSSECSDKDCWTPGTTPAGTVWTNSAKVPSQHTVWTHDRVASRIHGKTPPHQVKFGTNSSCDVATVAPTIADDLAELDDMMPEPATKRKIASCSQVLQADGSYRWCCPLCPFVLITNKDGKHFSGAKIGHVRNHHPNEKAATYLKKFKHRVKGQDVSELPEEAIAWKCVFCSFGVTRAECGNATRSPIANFGLRHRQECHPEIPMREWRRRRMQQTYEKNAGLRHRSRVRRLNASALKVKPPPPGHNCIPFTWPVVCRSDRTGGERRLHYRRAWACRNCLFCCHKRWPNYAIECKGPDVFKSCRGSALKTLAKHRAAIDEIPTGIPRREIEAQFDEAERFLTGVFPPLPS